MVKTFIGTSGFSYSHWKGIFYPQDLPQNDWFKFYCQNFQTVEINSSFYHLPKEETFERWRRETGPDFVFSIKGWRRITHLKKLKDCQNEVEKFFEAAKGIMVQGSSSRSYQKTSTCPREMGNYGLEVKRSSKCKETSPRRVITTANSFSSPSLDVVLWQLPPGLKVDIKRLEEFLKTLSLVSFPKCEAKTPPGCSRFAFEFRDKSWLNDGVYDLLSKYNSAIVFQDYPEWPINEEVTADFVYLRFHGRTSLYSSCYTEGELRIWAEKIKEWTRNGLDVYAYFNNDAMGWAVKNAETLKILSTKS